MTCDDFRALYLAGEETAASSRHLETCPVCRGDLAALRRLRGALEDPDLWQEPPGVLEDRVVAAVVEERRPNERRPWWVLAAAVAAVAVAVAVGLSREPGPPAPDWTVTLVGTQAAPHASGLVQGWETPSGTALFIRVDGLGRAPEGHYYELWFVGDKGRVSGGTFWEATGFELWGAASLEEYPEMGITLEPDDGDPAATGLKVMGSVAGP